jgi:hypothetical protein
MKAIKEFFTLILVIISLLSLVYFDYALFLVSNEPKAIDKDKSDSQEVCFTLNPLFAEGEQFYLEKKGD